MEYENPYLITFFLFLYKGAVLVSSIIYSLNLPNLNVDRVKCVLDTNRECATCDDINKDYLCPEWSDNHVDIVLRTVLKQSVCLAIFLLMYAMEALRFGLVLNRNLSHYEVDYV